MATLQPLEARRHSQNSCLLSGGILNTSECRAVRKRVVVAALRSSNKLILTNKMFTSYRLISLDDHMAVSVSAFQRERSTSLTDVNILRLMSRAIQP
jgi:hypothetical protein